MNSSILWSGNYSDGCIDRSPALERRSTLDLKLTGACSNHHNCREGYRACSKNTAYVYLLTKSTMPRVDRHSFKLRNPSYNPHLGIRGLVSYSRISFLLFFYFWLLFSCLPNLRKKIPWLYIFDKNTNEIS